MLDLIQEYYENINAGDKYTCDMCQVVAINDTEYAQNIRAGFHYCEPCWNYIHLKKGQCDCGVSFTRRSDRPVSELANCPNCNKGVQMTW